MRQNGVFEALGLSVLLVLGCGSEQGDDVSGSGGATLFLGAGGGRSAVEELNGGMVVLSAAQLAELATGACAANEYEVEPLAPVVDFVVDVSSSMESEAPGDTGRTKWEVTRDALAAAMQTLPNTAAVGMLFYPNFDDRNQLEEGTVVRDVSACVNVSEKIPITLLGAGVSDQRSTIESMIQNVTYTVGTPTYDAYHYALNESLLPFETLSKKFMVLITDGTPTYNAGCMNGPMTAVVADPQPIVDEVARAYEEHGISTFLIGSPGSETEREWLSQAALLGGTATEGCSAAGPDNWCHLDMTEAPDFGQALRAALAQIAGHIATCRFAIPESASGKGVDPDSGALVLTRGDGESVLVLRDNVGECVAGWNYDEEGQVVLCPDVCESLKVDGTAKMKMYFDCATTDVLRVY